jgi:periplasmic divalent cation tolerance protein
MLLIYTTAPDEQICKALAQGAIQAKYAACANIIPSIISVYEWEENITTSQEYAILFKTLEHKAQDLIRFICDNHPYKVPAIVQIQGKTTNNFMQYLQKNLKY